MNECKVSTGLVTERRFVLQPNNILFLFSECEVITYSTSDEW